MPVETERRPGTTHGAANALSAARDFRSRDNIVQPMQMLLTNRSNAMQFSLYVEQNARQPCR